MIVKTTKLEKQLFIGTMFFLLFQIMKHLSTDEKDMLTFYLLSVSGLFALIKILRFYTQANKTINIIWFSSLALIIAGTLLLINNYQLGGGIATVGSVVFWLTYHYSFLENRPVIQ